MILYILILFLIIGLLFVLRFNIKVYPFSPCYDGGFPLTKRMIAKNDYSNCKIAKFKFGPFDIGRCVFSLSQGIMKIESFEIKEGKRFKGYGKKFFNFILYYAKKNSIKGIYLTSMPNVHLFYSKCGMDLIDLDTFYVAFRNVCAKVNWLEVLSEKYL